MHKRLLLTLLAIFLSGYIFAQTQQDRWVWPDEHIEDALYPHLGIGPKVGVGVATATQPDFFDFDMGGGLAYQLGVAINFNIGHHASLGPKGIGRLGLEIEALFESRSFSTGHESLSMNCVEMPILLQFYISSEILLEVGFTPVKSLGTKPDYLCTGPTAVNVGGIKADDVMLTAGVCYKTKMGLSVDLRYNYGMSPWSENFESKTSTIMLGVNYLFSLIK